MALNSIRTRLLIGLLAALLVASGVAAAVTYARLHREADRLFDYQMRQAALSIPAEALVGPAEQTLSTGEGFVIQIWNLNGAPRFFPPPDLFLPHRAELGFTDVSTPRGAWRVYSAVVRDAVVQVAQPLELRRRLAADMALRSVLPMLLAIPVLAALLWTIVSGGLRPLRRLAASVRSRSPQSLEPVDETRLPDELAPLAHALNDLLARLGRALDAQRAFVGDAAHELRTPLAAVRLQVQLAERAPPGAERERAFAALRDGIDRATHLIEQLLTLAREEPDVAAARPAAPVALADLARQVVADHAATAAEKKVDLGLARADAATVAGDAGRLRILLNNLVDNAVRYTPAGGTVDVEVAAEGDQVRCTVTDSGPGIPAEERERVFDRFYRGTSAGPGGSGLGLAIARNIALQHGATLRLEDAPRGPGLRVVLALPAFKPLLNQAH